MAFEAPAAEVLLTAHRELEKLVLTARQQRIKETGGAALRRSGARGPAARSGVPRHRGAAAVLAGARHAARCTCCCGPAALFVEGVESPYSLMAASKGVYGEAAGEWTATDALGFSKIVALTGVFHRRAGEARQAPHAAWRSAASEKRRRRQDRLGHPGLRPGARSCASRATSRPRKAWSIVVEVLNQQVHLQHPGAHQRPHGQGRQGRHRGRRARHRKALFGYSGHVPSALKPGDIIQMLNIGGVLGICDSANPDKGKPFDCRVLGVVLHFPVSGRAHRRAGARRLPAARLRTRKLDTRGVPVVALAGTCMEAGKTAAACAIISRMRHRGLTIDAFKATGVSLRRDILAMEDAGARRTMIFTDLGVVTTTRANGPALTRTMLTELAAGKPDVIVFELGDGLLGTYGVDAILECADIRRALTGVVLSANDPVAAWGGVKLLRERFGIEPCVVTGPSTDNQVGVEIIEQQMEVAGLQRAARRARRSAIT